MKSSNAGYKIIVIICVSLIFMLSAKMILSRKNSKAYFPPLPLENQSAENNAKHFFLNDILHKKSDTITLTQEQLSELVRDKLSDKFPANTLNLSLSDDGSIGFLCTFEKQAFFDYLSENNFNLPSVLKSSIKFLPDPLSLSAVLSAETDLESKLLKLNAVSVKINDIELVQNSILSAVSDILTQSVNKVLCDSSYYFTDIVVKDDMIELKTS